MRVDRSQLKLHAQILHAPVALDAVAGAAQQLQVADVIGAALGLPDDVVHLQVPGLEVRPAARAVAVLLPVECLDVRAVRQELAQVRALWDVGAVRAPVEQAKLVAHSSLDQLGGLWGDVDTNPVAPVPPPASRWARHSWPSS